MTLDGWVADAARTFPVGEMSPLAQNLLERDRAVAATRAWSSASRASAWATSRTRSSRSPSAAGLAVVRSLVGHGVGGSMHEDPQVPNYGRAGKGPLLEEGMVLAIEPMTTAGRPRVRVAGDGWAIFSQDDSLAAHFEFTVAITAEGPRILTPWHLRPTQERARSAPLPSERGRDRRP